MIADQVDIARADLPFFTFLYLLETYKHYVVTLDNSLYWPHSNVKLILVQSVALIYVQLFQNHTITFIKIE